MTIVAGWRRSSQLVLITLAVVSTRLAWERDCFAAQQEAAAGASETGPSLVAADEDRALAFLRQLEALDARLAEERAREGARSQAALAKLAQLRHRLAGLEHGTADDPLYAAIVLELQEARRELRSALDGRGSPSALPTPPAALADPVPVDLGEGPAEELRAVRARIAQTEARLREDERAGRWSAIELRALRVDRLNALRLEAIDHLSAPYRSVLLGVSREGIAQLGRELDQVVLSGRYYLTLRAHEFHRLPALARDAIAVGAASYDLFALATVLGIAFYLRSRGAAIRDGLRRLLFHASSGVQQARRTSLLLEALQAFAPWTLFLLTLQGVRWALGDAAAWTELDVSYRIALLYGFYRLASDALYGFVLRLAHGYQLTLDAQRRDKLLGNARALMRVLVAITGLLYVSERLLGRGYLYHLVWRFSWVVVLLAFFRILAGWQTVLVESFLAARPQGRRAVLVRATRDRWYGVFVAAAAFAWHVAHALLTLARDFALGFDQTRRAMAFLFRRRVERQAERQGYSAVEVKSLPDGLAQAFAEGPVAEDRLLIDHFPGTELLRSAVARWSRGEVGGSFVITGERGIGKTTWLGHAQIEGLARQQVTLRQRLRDAGEVAGFFGAELGHPEREAASLGALSRWLEAGERRMVQVDIGQNLFLGTVGGYAGFEAFVALVTGTCQRVFWICSVNTFAWEHLSSVRPDLGVFRFRQALPSWSEEQIRALIRARNAASGVQLTYDDLMVGPLDGVSGAAQFLETEEGYTRLLWDYSDGNPRVALHFWLRSLVPESRYGARVRLCKLPAPEELQGVGETGLFLLAAVVIHENLTAEEAAAATRYPDWLCRVTLGRLTELGALQAEEGRYRVSTHWHRAAVRLLKRLNLLPD